MEVRFRIKEVPPHSRTNPCGCSVFFCEKQFVWGILKSWWHPVFYHEGEEIDGIPVVFSSLSAAFDRLRQHTASLKERKTKYYYLSLEPHQISLSQIPVKGGEVWPPFT